MATDPLPLAIQQGSPELKPAIPPEQIPLWSMKQEVMRNLSLLLLVCLQAIISL